MRVKLIEVILDNCTGCRLCEIACSFHHEQECSTSKSRIKILKDEEQGNHLVLLCIQCAEAYCVQSCSQGALYRDKAGVVQVNGETCDGCGVCLTTCPLNALSLNSETSVVFKCDLCGGDPECVKWCTRAAIVLKEGDVVSPAGKAYMEKACQLMREVV